MRTLLRLTIWAILAALPFCSAAFAQDGPITGVTFASSGRPAGGVNVAICDSFTTTAASLTSNIATLTFSGNPITAGFVASATITVSGFTGGDTYFNGTFTIAAVTSSTISYADTATNGSASSNGAVYQTGTQTQACAALAPLYTDYTGSYSSPNPFTSDGLGNYTAWAAPGYYAVQLYGPTVSTSIYYTAVGCVPGSGGSCGGTINGSIAATQVCYGASSNTCAGTSNFIYTATAGSNGLTLTSTDTTSNINRGNILTLCNSSSTHCAYLEKQADGSLTLRNDNQLIPGYGFFGFDLYGNVTLLSGAGGADLYLNTGAGTYPASSVDWELYDSGVGTAKYALHAGSPYNNLYEWDSGGGCSTWFTAGSTTNGGTLCPPASGTPNAMNLPIATATAGQHLESNGSSPQILTWKTPAVQCGTIAAAGACANTLTENEHCISGIANLSGGTSTITGISPAFTSSTTYYVITNDITTIADPSKGIPASGSSIVFTGTSTDSIQFIACGG